MEIFQGHQYSGEKILNFPALQSSTFIMEWLCEFYKKQNIAGLVENYGISNTVVLEIP